MLSHILHFLLRMGIIMAFSIFVWKFIKPRTQGARILRAALLAAGLLVMLAILRVAGS